MGGPLNAQLQRDGLPVHCFVTTHASKSAAVEKLMLAFERGEIKIPNDPVLIAELQSFEAKPLPSGLMRYAAPPGLHDDAVLALVIGWNALRDEGGCLGLVEFLQRGQAEMDAGRNPFMQLEVKPVANGKAAPQSDGPCPKCGSTLPPQRIPGGAHRCSICGFQ